MSDFLTEQLRHDNGDSELKMLLVPVSVILSETSTATTYSAVRQEQIMSATQIRSAKNGMQFVIVYSGFSLPSFTD